MSDPDNPNNTDPLTRQAAREWRQERERREGPYGRPMPTDASRTEEGRRLYREAQTPELRRHLRQVYSKPPAVERPTPDGFDLWSVEEQRAWVERVNKLDRRKRHHG